MKLYFHASITAQNCEIEGLYLIIFFVQEVFGESGKRRIGISNELFCLAPDAKEERERRDK